MTGTVVQLIFQMYNWVYFALSMNSYMAIYAICEIAKIQKLWEFKHVNNIEIIGISHNMGVDLHLELAELSEEQRNISLGYLFINKDFNHMMNLIMVKRLQKIIISEHHNSIV
jgi:hypothetical protein